MSLSRSAPLLSRKPLRRASRLERYTPLRPVNPKRRALLHARNFGDHAAFVRRQPCLVRQVVCPDLRTSCYGQVEAAHVVTRKMGGCGTSWRTLIPLCQGHHEEQEGRGGSFERTYGVDLELLADVYIIADQGAAPEERHAALARAMARAPEGLAPLSLDEAPADVFGMWAVLGKAVGR